MLKNSMLLVHAGHEQPILLSSLPDTQSIVLNLHLTIQALLCLGSTASEASEAGQCFRDCN